MAVGAVAAGAAAGSGATAQPAGSATGALPASGVNEEVAVPDEVAAAAGAAEALRLRKAVTSLAVVTMPTTLHPSADFAVRAAASAAGSFEDELAVENSCGSDIRRRVSRSQPARTS